MKDHTEKDSGIGTQTGGLGQLGRRQRRCTRQGLVESKSCSLEGLMAQRIENERTNELASEQTSERSAERMKERRKEGRIWKERTKEVTK